MDATTPTPAVDSLEQAHLLWMRGRCQEAQAAVKAILEKSPEDPDAIDLLAQIEQQMRSASQEQLWQTERREWLRTDGRAPLYSTIAVFLAVCLIDIPTAQSVRSSGPSGDTHLWWPTSRAGMSLPTPLAITASLFLLAGLVACIVWLARSYREAREDFDSSLAEP
jgi:hypothetical protein